MKETLVSEQTFRWILTALTFAACVWVFYDVVRLVRLRRADHRDVLVRDKRFGYLIGIVLGVFGIVGILKYRGLL